MFGSQKSGFSKLFVFVIVLKIRLRNSKKEVTRSTSQPLEEADRYFSLLCFIIIVLLARSFWQKEALTHKIEKDLLFTVSTKEIKGEFWSHRL